MQAPPEISYRNVEKSDDIEDLIQKKIAKLKQVCSYMVSFRVAIERRRRHRQSGNPYTIRIEVRVPPGHELVVKRISTEGEQEEPLSAVLRKGFEAMRRQLKELVEKQRCEVKVHPRQQVIALVERLFPEKGFGFLRTTDSGREIYFHRNSALHNEYERMEIGTGVSFTEETGEEGPQASSVEIVDKPGISRNKTA